MSRIIGQERIAEVFGVAPKTIVEWQEQGFPVALRGGPGVPSEYESAECIRWFVDREMSNAQVETPNNRLARAKAEAQEMNNAQRRGLLIPAELLEPRLKAMVVDAREMLRAEPPRLAREAYGKTPHEVEDLLTAVFDEFLIRLSLWPKDFNQPKEQKNVD